MFFLFFNIFICIDLDMSIENPFLLDKSILGK